MKVDMLLTKNFTIIWMEIINITFLYIMSKSIKSFREQSILDKASIDGLSLTTSQSV